MAVMDRRESDIAIAVLEERIRQIEKRCDAKDIAIAVLQKFHHTAIGYCMCASAVVAALMHYFWR